MSMDVFVLNQQLETVDIVEEYESMIWTDRYSTDGDFQLKAYASPAALDVVKPSSFLSIDHSDRLMMIEELSTDYDDEDRAIYTAKGRSIESFLESRFVPPGYSATGNIAAIVHDLVRRVCVQGTGVFIQDIIPKLSVPDWYVSGPEVKPTFTVKSLRQTVKELCDAAGLGFKITRTLAGGLSAEVYEGKEQPVVFTPELDNLANTKYLESIADYYNIAYVYSKTHSLTVTGKGVTTAVSGFRRRSLPVDATSIETTSANYVELLTQKGKEALAEHRRLTAFDGEIDPENGTYKYPRDYSLGDIVGLGDDYGHSAKSRVTEHIWTKDSEGFRAYPTFTALED